MSHLHQPQHVHGDVNGRLSRRALKDLTNAEAWAKEQLALHGDDKLELKRVGDELLQRYVDALDRPGAFLQKGFCQMPSSQLCQSQSHCCMLVR